MNNKKEPKEELGEQIEKQVEECLDKIDKAITGYHLAVRYLALKRILNDETSIMNREYQWIDHWIPPPLSNDNMIR